MTQIFKNSFAALLLIGTLAVMFSTLSCNKLCDGGYEGKRCDVPIRDKFLGVWNAVDNPGNLTYKDTISEGSDVQDVVISRSFSMDTFHRPIRATISDNAINIATQRPHPAKPLLVEGTGTISSDFTTISWTYNLIDTSQTPHAVTNYTGVWSK